MSLEEYHEYSTQIPSSFLNYKVESQKVNKIVFHYMNSGVNLLLLFIMSFL